MVRKERVRETRFHLGQLQLLATGRAPLGGSLRRHLDDVGVVEHQSPPVPGAGWVTPATRTRHQTKHAWEVQKSPPNRRQRRETARKKDRRRPARSPGRALRHRPWRRGRRQCDRSRRGGGGARGAVRGLGADRGGNIDFVQKKGGARGEATKERVKRVSKFLAFALSLWGLRKQWRALLPGPDSGPRLWRGSGLLGMWGQ